jgi:dienelactone hydrolase
MSQENLSSIASVEIKGVGDAPAMARYQSFHFQHHDTQHLVFHRGDGSHPPLLIMSELAGIAPGLLMFADRLVKNGYQVYLPWMFGPLGKRAPIRNAMRLCISREFSKLQAGVSAPITDWLRALTLYISEQNGGRKVGAIGMCLTGAFAIPLIIDPHVTVGVAAQPSVPFSILHRMTGLAVNNLGELNVSDGDIAAARQRLNSNDAHLFACRFRADRVCAEEKIERLRREFPVNLEVHEYGEDSSRNVLGKRPHATFTKEYRIAEEAGIVDSLAQHAFADLLVFLQTYLNDALLT